MRELKRKGDFLIIASFAFILSFGACSTLEEDTYIKEDGERKPNYGLDEGFETLNFAELEYNVNEEMAKEVAKVKFTEVSPEGRTEKPDWEDIEAEAYPVYSYDGVRKYYVCNVYFGPGDMPAHDDMMKNIEKGYKASNKYHRMKLEGKTVDEIPDTIKEDIRLMSGANPKTGKREYWSFVVPGSTFIPIGSGRPSIHDFFRNYYKAVDFAEEDYGLTDVEVAGYIWEGNYGYFRLKSGDDYYYCPNTSFWMYHKLYTEEEVKDRTKDNATGKYLKYALELSDEAWRRRIEKAERYNSGELVEY